MPKPTASLTLSDGDLIQIVFFYRTRPTENLFKKHRLTLCYSIDTPKQLEIMDRVLVQEIKAKIISNCLVRFFGEGTFFEEIEITVKAQSGENFRGKFDLIPPVWGVANPDPQISYSGTYSAQFMEIQGTRPIPLARFQLFNFYAPRTLTDPEVILEKMLFNTVWLEVFIPEKYVFSLQFYGTTLNRPIDLTSPTVYVQEKILF